MTPDHEGQIGPRVTPLVWNYLREVVIFALGVGLIIDCALTPGGRVSLLVTGLILIGLIPVDRLLARMGEGSGRERLRSLRQSHGRRVIVHIEEGPEFGGQFEGRLWRSGRVLTLREAASFDHGHRVEIDGEVVLELDRVRWVQVLPSGSAA
jgi:hypothetical protein